MAYYIMAIGPYDASFIGPFISKDQAKAFYNDAVVQFQGLDFYGPIHKKEVNRNLVEFGPTPIQSPSTFTGE